VTEADLDGKLGPVPTPAGQIEADAHRAYPGLGEVPGAMVRVSVTDPFRQQDLERLPEQLGARVVEHPLGRRVDQRDPAGGVDQHDALGGGFEHRPRHVLGASEGRLGEPRLARERFLGPQVRGRARLELGDPLPQPLELGVAGSRAVRSFLHDETMTRRTRSMSRA
jgi:hypothetical protein